MKNTRVKQSNEIDSQLFDAIGKNNISLIKRLIKKGANVNSYHKYWLDNFYTALYRSLQERKLEIAKLLINSGADIKLPFYYAYCDKSLPPLSTTIGSEIFHLEGLKLLLKAGLDLSVYDQEWNPLMEACSRSGNEEENKILFEICELLIKNGAVINYVSKNEETPLFNASVKGNKNIAELLINNGAKKNLASCFLLGDFENISKFRSKPYLVNNEAYILCKAAEYNNLELLQIMHDFGVDLNISIIDYCKRTQTVLDYASHPVIIEWLLKNGVKRISTESVCKAASSLYNADKLKILLNAGADPNDKWQTTYTTALHTALSSEFLYEKAKLLLDAGADVNAKDKEELSSMHHIFQEEISSNLSCNKEGGSFYASGEEILKTINVLIEKGASAAEKDIFGNTPLHIAAKNGYSSNILAKLITLGNNPNDKNLYGETPAILAAKNNKKEAFDFLASSVDRQDLIAIICLSEPEVALQYINMTQNFDIKDSKYYTLLHYMVSRGSLDMVKALVKKGVEINAFNKYYRTAFDLAINKGKSSISEYLKEQGGQSYNAVIKNKFNRCFCWAPQARGEVIINYNIEGITKEYSDQYNFKTATLPISSSQKAILIKVLEYISSVFTINFNEVSNLNETDLYIGQVLDKINDNSSDWKIKANEFIDKASLCINGVNINDAKIKLYPNYCFAKILQNIIHLLGFSNQNYSLEARSVMDSVVAGLLDEEYNINFSDFDILVLSSRYLLKESYREKINISNQEIKPVEITVIPRGALNILLTGKELDVRKLIENGFEFNKSFKLTEEGNNKIYPIRQAIEGNNIEAVKVLMEYNAKVGLVRNSFNLLADACNKADLKASLQLVNILLEAGVDPNFHTYNTYNNIALTKAAKHNNIEVCKLLIDNGAELNTRDYFGQTAIQTAALYGAIEVVQLLYEKGAELDLASAFVLDLQNKITKLIQYYKPSELQKLLQELMSESIKKENLMLIKALVKYGVSIADKDFIGSIKYPTIEIVKYLILNVENIDAQDMDGNTALHITANSLANIDILESLLIAGVSLEVKNRVGYTALHKAILADNYNAITLLIKYGADIRAKDKERNSVFHIIAKQSRLLKYCSLFVREGLDINEINNNGNMLHDAIENKLDCIVVDVFKECGGNLNPNLTNYIEYAIYCEYLDIIPNLLVNNVKINLISALMLKMPSEALKILKDYYDSKEKEMDICDIYEADLDGNTCLHHAAREGYLDIVYLLIKKGAKINILNEQKETALDLAKQKKDNFIDKNNALITLLESYGGVSGDLVPSIDSGASIDHIAKHKRKKEMLAFFDTDKIPDILN